MDSLSEESKSPNPKDSRKNLFSNKNEKEPTSSHSKGDNHPLKKSLSKYMQMEERDHRDFRSSLGPGEQKLFDKREEDLEMQILETINTHTENHTEKVGWEKVEKLCEEFLNKEAENEGEDQRGADSDVATFNGYYYKGLACHELKKYREAITALDKARILAPTNSDVHYYLGLSSLKSGFYNKSMERFNDCLKYDKSNIYAYNNLAYVYNITCHFQKTIDI